jgi:(E)-4-hydroxy-3-methyl-but-2-enyl pyrophosphate reductase
MPITIDPKAKSCPGVMRALEVATEKLSRGEAVFALGQLIHNSREMERLESMGLRMVGPKWLLDTSTDVTGGYFLVRAHGESPTVIRQAKERGLVVLDATCSIVHHSHEVIEQHIREGWGIAIVGNPSHPEVEALLARSNGYAVVISGIKDIAKNDFEAQTLLLAQTTVDPVLFATIRKAMIPKVMNLKMIDTTCRFLRLRQNDMKAFAQSQDVVIIIGGVNSANSRLLYETAKSVNPNSHFVESPGELKERFDLALKIGISGGTSTPRWQLEEMKSFLENQVETNPKGLKNKKGGKTSWWLRKNATT